MMPDELRLLAVHWRNIAGAAEQQARYMRDAGLSGVVLYMADASTLNANSCAEQLEERASELEKMGGIQ